MINENQPAFPIRFDKMDRANSVDYYFGLTKLEYTVIEIYKSIPWGDIRSSDRSKRSIELAKELFKFLKEEVSP